jgi:hypothetical protein
MSGLRRDRTVTSGISETEDCMAVSELDQIKQGARESWAAGDYELVAKHLIWDVRDIENILAGADREALDDSLS